jgi:hypothetical protein
VDDVCRYVGDGLGQGLCQSDLVLLVDSIRVGLNYADVWFRIEKIPNFEVKINDAFLCVRDQLLRAFEQVRYAVLPF